MQSGGESRDVHKEISSADGRDIKAMLNEIENVLPQVPKDQDYIRKLYEHYRDVPALLSYSTLDNIESEVRTLRNFVHRLLAKKS